MTARTEQIPAHAPLALTMGDPAGIGPEITIDAWLQRDADAIPPFVVYADHDLLKSRASRLGRTVPVKIVSSPREAPSVFAEALPVVGIPLAVEAVAGAPDVANATATIRSIDLAVADVASGAASALVTNPIAKSVLYAAGFAHPGHTEYLAHLSAQLAGGPAPRPVMMLVGDDLRTVPVTIHIPLADVPRALSASLIAETIRIAARDLTRRFGIARPRIAVAGLNPHAGESGTIGTEDRDLIAPVITRLEAEGLAVTGPHPADTLFHAAARARYDVAVCMYHDQALIPVKTLAFDTGVNVTLGLPFIRTSPDHGTAFDIAGTGRASPQSLIAALKLAARMAAASAAVPVALT